MYFSGSFSNELVEYLLARDACRLVSFAYPREVYQYTDMAATAGKTVDLMVDSGAFTAWNIGKPVQLQELIDQYKRLEDEVAHYCSLTFISLDVIPGERTRHPTKDEVQAGMDESFDNWLRLREEITAGPVLPVYHSGEPQWFRDKFLALTDHMCLSMLQNMAEKARVAWAMEAQAGTHTVNGKQLPVKWHGLAATGQRIMERVDWHSVDSSGWLVAGSMGKILWDNGDGTMRPLNISKESPTRKARGQHIQNMPERDFFFDGIRQRGYDPDELASDYKKRWKWNVDAWIRFQPRKRVTRALSLFGL